MIAFCHEFRPSFNKNPKHAYITNLRLIQTITIPVSKNLGQVSATSLESHGARFENDPSKAELIYIRVHLAAGSSA